MALTEWTLGSKNWYRRCWNHGKECEYVENEGGLWGVSNHLGNQGVTEAIGDLFFSK